MNRKRTHAFISSLLLAMLLLSACSFSLPGQQSVQSTATLEPVAGLNTDLIIVEGRLIPNQTINLAFSASGLVKDLYVSEGSDVSSGQVIARLEGAEQVKAAIENANIELLSAQQAIDALDENYAAMLADAQKKLAQAKIDLNEAQDDRTSMVYRRASDATLDALRADVILSQEALDLAQDYYDHHSSGDELVAAQALRDLASARSAHDRAEYNLIYASGLPNKDEIDRADADVRIAETKVTTARLNLERLASGPDSREMALAVARLQAAEVNLIAAQVQLSNLDLVAPMDGTIVNLEVARGEQVNPGQVIAILADFSQWVVETSDLTELSVVKTRPGQQVTLIADALPDLEMSGTVERISNSYLEKQGDITYTVRILLNQKEDWLRWGMTFSVQLDTASASQAVGPDEQSPAGTATPVSEGAASEGAASAEATLKGFFAALEKMNAPEAAGFLSNYSLVASRISRKEVIESIETQFEQGTRWSELVVNESQEQDSTTVLLHVLYKITTKDAETGKEVVSEQDEWWPVRLENGTWLYNWQNVLDYRELDIADQTTGGLTLNPVQIVLYSDRMQLVLFAQNRTNDPIVLGQPNETLALFSFGEKTVEAEAARFIFQPMRTYPEIRIDVQGSYSEYPDKVVIRKWKNVQTEPWYTFILSPGF